MTYQSVSTGNKMKGECDRVQAGTVIAVIFISHLPISEGGGEK